MDSKAAKRKAPSSLRVPTKRQRIEKGPPSPVGLVEESDDDEETYCPGNDEFSEDEVDADTPITPSSPAGKTFPSRVKTLECSYEGCTKTFNRPARLAAHIRTHTNERPFVCTYEGCSKNYLEDKHLQQHIKGSHTKERAFQCDWEGCGKSFLTSTRLNRHHSTHVGANIYRCTAHPPCNETFRKHNTLQRHIRTDHLQLSPYPCTFVDPITSEACDASFDGATGLRQHVDRVHSATRKTCPQCAAPGFKTDRELQAHIKKEHANCMFCDTRCSSQQQLQKHIEIHHSGTTLEQRKNVPCTYPGCNKRFTKQNNLKSHIRTAHMGERFICGTFDVSSYPDITGFQQSDGCGNDFVSKASLVDHIRTAHLGLKSVVNSNRKKSSHVSDSEESDAVREMDGEADYVNKKKKKSKRGKKAQAAMINDLVGYDQSSTIPCLIVGCPQMFTQQDNLQSHMSVAHPILPPPGPDMNFGVFEDHSPDRQANFGFLDHASSMEAAMMPDFHEFTGREEEQADFDWELQRRALEGGAFWVGADAGLREYRGNEDDWSREEREMRGLID